MRNDIAMFSVSHEYVPFGRDLCVQGGENKLYDLLLRFQFDRTIIPPFSLSPNMQNADTGGFCRQGRKRGPNVRPRVIWDDLKRMNMCLYSINRMVCEKR